MMSPVQEQSVSLLIEERERLVEETKSYQGLPQDAALSDEEFDRCIEELRAIRLRIHAIDEHLRAAGSINPAHNERSTHEAR